MTLYHGASIVTSGLTMMLDAANLRSYPGSGTTWSDLSGNGNDGTLQASPTYSSSNLGYFGFNGTSNYVSTITLLSSPGPQIFSLSVWFQTGTASGHKIIGYENRQTGTTSTLADRHLYVGTDGLLYFGVYNSGFFYATTPNTINDNKWHYAVATYSNVTTQLLLYVDSALVASGSTSAAYAYAGYWRIGSYKNGDWTNGVDGYFPGNISNAQIYNQVLTAAQVAQNFNAHRGRYGI